VLWFRSSGIGLSRSGNDQREDINQQRNTGIIAVARESQCDRDVACRE
jgi:hypothetical protein